VIDPRTWLLWTLLTMVLAVINRNPLVAIVVLLIALAVESAGRINQSRRLPFSPIRIAGVVIVLSSVYNGLAVHVGNTVLFQVPNWLPYFGGPVTLEALVFGASNGLTLAVIFTIFAVFNQMTATHDLIGLMPRGLHDVGVVVSIALTFIPQTTASIARISEAQAVRGHRIRGPRDLLPLLECGLTLVLAILPSLLLNSTALDYSPYLALTLPAFDPLTGLGLVGLLAPVARVR
jgi:energy-coupling factor transport system permease protein